MFPISRLPNHAALKKVSFIGYLLLGFNAFPIHAEETEEIAFEIRLPCIVIPGVIYFLKTTIENSCSEEDTIIEAEPDNLMSWHQANILIGSSPSSKTSSVVLLETSIDENDLQPGECFRDGNRLVCNMGRIPAQTSVTISHFFTPLQAGSLNMTIRLWPRSGSRELAVISPVAKTVVLPVLKRLVYPWISNNAGQFKSLLIANNFGNEEAVVSLKAMRSQGEPEIVMRTLLPGESIREEASELFPSLGSGPGYSVLLESSSTFVSGHWVTNNLTTDSGLSPSQGVAVDVTDFHAPQSKRFGRDIGFGYLPTTQGLTSAPVIINLDPTPADVVLRFYDSAGNLVFEDGSRLRALEPMRPFATVINDLVPSGSGDLRMVASSSNRLTGVAFVFNSLGEPAIGNVKTLRQTLPQGATTRSDH